MQIPWFRLMSQSRFYTLDEKRLHALNPEVLQFSGHDPNHQARERNYPLGLSLQKYGTEYPHWFRDWRQILVSVPRYAPSTFYLVRTLISFALVLKRGPCSLPFDVLNEVRGIDRLWARFRAVEHGVTSPNSIFTTYQGQPFGFCSVSGISYEPRSFDEGCRTGILRIRPAHGTGREAGHAVNAIDRNIDGFPIFW